MTQDYQGPQAPKQPPVPPELVQLWWNDGWSYYNVARCAATWAWEQAMTTLAEREQAAADAELKACCYTLLGHFRSTTWSNGSTCGNMAAMVSRLRAARRPKPPTMAEQALAAQQRMWAGSSTHDDWENVRAALLLLQELEQAATATTETTHD